MARLFLAVHPPQEVIELLRELPRKDQRGVRFVPPENWHATLRFFGQAEIDDVVEVMNRVEHPAAVACLGPAIDMLGTHSVIAPIDGMQELAAHVVDTTIGIGEFPPRPTFNGHITIARVRRNAIVRKVIGMLCSAQFPVTDVALVESHLRPTGSIYETVATWPTTSGFGSLPSDRP